jgi:hypothetical protein
LSELQHDIKAKQVETRSKPDCTLRGNACSTNKVASRQASKPASQAATSFLQHMMVPPVRSQAAQMLPGGEQPACGTAVHLTYLQYAKPVPQWPHREQQRVLSGQAPLPTLPRPHSAPAQEKQKQARQGANNALRKVSTLLAAIQNQATMHCTRPGG